MADFFKYYVIFCVGLILGLLLFIFIGDAGDVNETGASILADEICDIKFNTTAEYWDGEILECSKEKTDPYTMRIS